MKIILFILFILVLANNAFGQEILSVDNARSYVLNLDDGGKKYPLENFLKSEQLSFMEGQKLETHIFIIRNPASNPRDTYVLEMRTDLGNAEWHYKIFEETTVFKTVKLTVWNSSRDHSASSFEIVLSGEVPKPAIKIEEPHFESYTGEGPGLRNSGLAIFTIYDGQVDPVKKVQEVGEYTFLSTNSIIKGYLEEIKKNLDTSSLRKDYADALEEQKIYILKLGNNDGHVGIALDQSKSFAGVVGKLTNISPPDNRNTLLISIVVAILLALTTGLIGYKVGHSGEKVSPEILDQIDRSYNTLKQNVEKLEKIDISSIPAARDQATELETIKRQVAPSIAGLKNILNQLR